MVAKETAKVSSREEVKKQNKAKKEKDTTKQKDKFSLRIRLIPIWLRLLLVIIFMIVSSVVGLIVGYGVIGNGNPADALDKSTWQHIIDLVEKE